MYKSLGSAIQVGDANKALAFHLISSGCYVHLENETTSKISLSSLPPPITLYNSDK